MVEITETEQLNGLSGFNPGLLEFSVSAIILFMLEEALPLEDPGLDDT